MPGVGARDQGGEGGRQIQSQTLHPAFFILVYISMLYRIVIPFLKNSHFYPFHRMRVKHIPHISGANKASEW